ncbi:MAG TPA: PQQ-dependent dehydrogenase, methanol/ethanol family, partial [Pseudonocardiaceae bacterium]|nr:PQQ-dependent dehydrogenase, methanol/ethanol family [Pseudonocardiaceae bacterium]
WIHQASSTGLIASTSTYAFEACPLVVDGVMFVTGWDGWLWALDAVTGEQLWRYKHAIPFDVTLCCANVNRGCAVANGKVYMVTQNAQLVAIDATNGQKVWQKTIGDVRAGESASIAPLVVKDTLITGSAGGEYGVRGHIDCWDLETGEQRWRTYTVPKPGEPGSETWPADGEAWQRGGANHWVTGTYDPELNLYYAGTGNPAPDFDGEVRRGDNLYSDSVVALDVDTGEIKWHYQFTPHDLWDYDSTMEMTLFERDGKKLLAHFDKNGYMFVLDRTNGELQHVTPFVDRIDWGVITRDGKVTPRKYPDKEGEPCHFYPGPAGAKEWTHASYNPDHDLFYVPVADVGATATRRRREFKEGMPYWGAAVEVDVDNMAGSVSAFDSHGEEKWRYRLDMPMAASTLSTAGNVVFAGTPTGEFMALHAETGEKLWSFQCGSGHHSSPSTYMVDGKQYITVPVGWGGWLEGIIPGMSGQGHGAAVITFSL